MTSRELKAKLADAMRLVDMTEKLLGCQDDYNRLWYADMLKDELFDFRERYEDGDAI